MSGNPQVVLRDRCWVDVRSLTELMPSSLGAAPVAVSRSLDGSVLNIGGEDWRGQLSACDLKRK